MVVNPATSQAGARTFTPASPAAGNHTVTRSWPPRPQARRGSGRPVPAAPDTSLRPAEADPIQPPAATTRHKGPAPVTWPDRQPLMTQRHRKPPATRASPPICAGWRPATSGCLLGPNNRYGRSSVGSAVSGGRVDGGRTAGRRQRAWGHVGRRAGGEHLSTDTSPCDVENRLFTNPGASSSKAVSSIRASHSV